MHCTRPDGVGPRSSNTSGRTEPALKMIYLRSFQEPTLCPHHSFIADPIFAAESNEATQTINPKIGTRAVTLPKSYRPISRLNTAAACERFLERAWQILTRLASHLERRRPTWRVAMQHERDDEPEDSY